MSRGMNSVRAIVFVSAVVYGALAIAMGVVPGLVLSNTEPTPGLQPLTPVQARGREVYVSEGCAYCHTQNVRPLAQDKVFGRPSVAGDYAFSTPELLGDHRNGPDLSDIGTRQPSDVWQYIHLYEPRALVSQSIMPSYRWMFAVKPKVEHGDIAVPIPQPWAPGGAVVVPTEDARDLVAYLKYLTQPPLGKETRP